MSERSFQDAKIRVFREIGADNSYRAYFDELPMRFSGFSESDVRARAEAWRTDEIAKVMARREALANARSARGKTAAAAEPESEPQESAA